jgi:hypothetical protein
MDSDTPCLDCISLTFLLLLLLFFQDSISLCSPGCPGTHFLDQAGLELRNPPASASQVLGLKACATMPSLKMFLIRLLSPILWLVSDTGGMLIGVFH